VNRWLTIGLGAAALAWWATQPKRSPNVPVGFWHKATELLGGRPIDPESFPNNFGGLNRYLAASRGDPVFTEHELVTDYCFPLKEDWPKRAAIAGLADRAARAANGQVVVRRVCGESIELVFETPDQCAQAEVSIQALSNAEPWLKIGLGVGQIELLIDMLTNRSDRPSEWRF